MLLALHAKRARKKKLRLSSDASSRKAVRHSRCSLENSFGELSKDLNGHSARCASSASSPESPNVDTHTAPPAPEVEDAYGEAFALAVKAAAAESGTCRDYQAAAGLYQGAGEILVKAALRDLDMAAKTKGDEFLARAKLLRVCGVFGNDPQSD
jgi:hypothetical protein